MTGINLLSVSMRKSEPKAGADWVRFVAAKKKDEPSRIYIYDEIGYWGTSAASFVQKLNEIDASVIELHLNTPGGAVFEALAISAALKRHPAKIVAYVDGLAASSGSFILQAADERLIYRNASIMIHEAKSGVYGTAKQLEDGAALLGKISDNIADIYASRSGVGTTASWRAVMLEGDKWYDGNEALQAGLVDQVVDDDESSDDTKNEWTAEDVEAFLKSAENSLSGNGEHLVIKKQYKETEVSNILTGSRGEPINSGAPAAPTQGNPNPAATQADPAAATTAPAAHPVSAPPAASAPAQGDGAPAAGVGVIINGAPVTDPAAIQAHISELEGFRNETIRDGRKAFVNSLAAAGQILANEETIAATTEFALSLSNDMFEKWKKTMEVAPANALFQNHGATNGSMASSAGTHFGVTVNEVQDRISVLENIIASHRAAGLSDEQIEAKSSYKELETLKAQVAQQ